jgi:hypothetical protein
LSPTVTAATCCTSSSGAADLGATLEGAPIKLLRRDAHVVVVASDAHVVFDVRYLRRVACRNLMRAASFAVAGLTSIAAR